MKIEPKPLAPTTRDDIERQFVEYQVEPSEGWFSGQEMSEALAAEQYWREVVKKMDPFINHRDQSADWKECRFCGGGWGPQHLPGCPWLLAQSENTSG